MSQPPKTPYSACAVIARNARSSQQRPRTQEYSPACGFLFAHADLQFWMDGLGQGWSILLPYCPECHREVGMRNTYAA